MNINTFLLGWITNVTHMTVHHAAIRWLVQMNLLIFIHFPNKIVQGAQYNTYACITGGRSWQEYNMFKSELPGMTSTNYSLMVPY